MSSSALDQELIELTRKLLKSISDRDWDAYAALCEADLTCFEPEAKGAFVEGLEFHRFYFDNLVASGQSDSICSPSVRMIGEDVGIVCYSRLTQRMAGEGPSTERFEETRVWVRGARGWKLAHFHRSN